MGTTVPHTNGPKGKEPADHHVLVYQKLEPELNVELLREPPPYLEEHCARSIRGPKSLRNRYSLEAPFLFFYSNANPYLIYTKPYLSLVSCALYSSSARLEEICLSYRGTVGAGNTWRIPMSREYATDGLVPDTYPVLKWIILDFSWFTLILLCMHHILKTTYLIQVKFRPLKPSQPHSKNPFFHHQCQRIH